jgi:hypothetical protein
VGLQTASGQQPDHTAEPEPVAMDQKGLEMGLVEQSAPLVEEQPALDVPDAMQLEQ